MGSFISRRMSNLSNTAESVGSGSDSDSDSLQDFQHNYSHILQGLINSMFPGDHQGHTRPPILFSGRISRLPQTELPNTQVLDKSEFSLMTKQSCNVQGLKRRLSKTDTNITNLITNREKGLYVNERFSESTKCSISNRFLPNDVGILDSFSGKVFCGLFSKDGERFITASQDRSITLYDSSNGSYKYLYSILARDVGWSIVDVTFSPKREHFVYSTWSADLHLCSATENNDHQEPLSLVRSGRRFCVFSVVFSSDGKELLGGANDGCLYIYDLQRHSRTLSIPAHEYDVNSVCFADDSSHIIYSGGDDGLVKVWDRRTLIECDPKPVGFLAGHMDGVTFIDSRGDGRHLISNSKDQSIKLWDVRVFSGEKAAEKSFKAVNDQTWDYRWQEVPRELLSFKNKIEGDTSIMTYRGHIVIKTLIRCRFSPVETTGQRYIYTGCGVGRVVIYDALTGAIVRDKTGHSACVRDVSWHPSRNEILSSSWDGRVGRWYHSTQDYLVSCGDDYQIDFDKASPIRRSYRLKKKRQLQLQQQGSC